MMRWPVVLVTGAGGAAGRNLIRCLRMDGAPLRVVGTDTHRLQLECADDLDARHVVPACDDPEYLARLREVCRCESADLILPQPDPEVAVISESRSVLPGVALPPVDVIAMCQDKASCREALASAGVSVPEVWPIDYPGLFDDGPVWVRAIRGAGSKAALPVSNRVQLDGWLDYWQGRGLAADDFMASEFLPGREFAWQSLWWEGRLITSMARQRLEYLGAAQSPSGQSSSPSVAVTVHEPAVNDVASAAVRAVSGEHGPHGVFCVDLKEDAAGQPKVMEINAGRFFTTSNFFAQAGCNMPRTLVTLALGGDVGPQPAFDALPAGLLWVRGMDRTPRLIR